MINTLLKFEAKILNGSKDVTFKRNYTQFLSFKANLTLKGQGQGQEFSKISEIFR